MTLVEVFALQLGPAIAKAILKVWLKDAGVLADVSGSLVDLLKGKTQDVLAQQKAKRQLEEIGEKVAESLLPVFEAGGAALDESSRIAVAQQVADTLEGARIDASLLASKDLEPARLAQYLRETQPDATRLFSADETALYERMLSECCQYVVDIASQFPHFDERTFAEVLKRQNLLLDVAQRILDEVRRIREGSSRANPEAEAARFETEYRRAVVRKLDELELFGADLATSSRRYRLSVAYVTLSAERQTPLTRGDAPTTLATGEENRGEIVRIEKLLGQSPRVVIRGLPGSGKTTLLQWIAVRAASKDFPEALQDWNDVLPFFIRLRQCAASPLPAPEAFPSMVVPAIAGTMPEGWVHNRLRSGHAVVLVDGVDEIPKDRRQEVQDWLRDLIATYPTARFIVTSRPHAVRVGWMAPHRMDQAELQPMNRGDIDIFIEQWHAAVREEAQEAEEKDRLDKLSQNLQDILPENRPIRNLATSPLLCAMLCALHRDRHQQLPANRVELYEACCWMLLERRDIERRVELSDYPILRYRQKRRLLEDLAYYLLRNGWSEVELEQAEKRFSSKLEQMPGLAGSVTGTDVRRLLVERSGILRETVAGQVDFVHRTFQDFLAAQAALDEGDLGVLVGQAHDDQWREVILLAAGLANVRERDNLIERLMARGDQDSRHRHSLHVLAVACLETADECGPAVRNLVRVRLAQLVPPRDMTEARAIAAAGELAIPYLADGARHPGPMAAGCVRALAMIGGPAALQALEAYAKDSRQVVLQELLKAWDLFDREEYARRVLARFCPNEVELISQPLDGLQYLAGLTSLKVRQSRSIKDLSLLAGLTQLTQLELRNCPAVSDLRPLAGLTKLTSLHLRYCCSVSDLGPLAGLNQLTRLALGNCPNVSDLGPLAGLTQLTSLDLGYCPRVSDLGPLAKLTKLGSLILTDCENVSDLGPLAGLTQLTSLDLGYCLRVSDLGPLAGLTKLSSLNLGGCARISDLRPLARLTQLAQLNLWECPKVSDLSPLAALRNLHVSRL